MNLNIENRFPRLLIGAPGSGSGKTLITCALLRILSKKGYNPSGFKCGPDFIDPMFHRKVLGIPSRNLDVFLQGIDGINKIFYESQNNGADIGIIEGVMGFFDGMGVLSMDGSSYDICVKTGTSAILVVNCKGMSRSIIPMIKGYLDYGKEKVIKGIILNNCSSSIASIISKEVEEELSIPVIAYLSNMKKQLFSSRHLGLVMPDEVPEIMEIIDEVAAELEKSLNISKLIDIANESGILTSSCTGISHLLVTNTSTYKEEKVVVSELETRDKKSLVKIGVALDEAFCFYYEDNLELLKKMGAELAFFSPLHDRKLPDVDGIIIGGGYPELYAEKLSQNESMKASIKKAADNKMPILAECGGFLYLNKSLHGIDKKIYPMVGFFDADGFYTGKLNHFGYINVCCENENPYLKKGEVIKGHEFHYYDTTDNGNICRMKKPTGKRSWTGICCKNNVFAGFAHLYYPSCTNFIINFFKLLTSS